MYWSWQHFKKRYTNDEVSKRHSLISQMSEEGIIPFKLKTLDGKDYSSEDMRGKLAFVNFWASWCDPCVREFPSMLNLVEHFKGKLILVAISNDENKEDMENFAKAFGAKRENVYILWDPDRKVSSSYGTNQLPETYMVAPDLKLIRKIIGVEKWDTPDAKDYLSDVLHMHGL